MWSFTLLVLAISAVVLAEDKDSDVISMQNTFNCYADYLKRHGVLEPNYESQPFQGEAYFCEMILSTTINRVYGDLYKEFHENENFKSSAECIVTQLRDAKWSDLDIKEQIYEASDLFTQSEKEQKIREIKYLQEKISGNAILTCLSTKEFGELFESIINNSTNDDDDDLVGDYCARKYGIENNLIDTQQYELDVNPRGIITTYIQCDIVNNQHFNEAELELREHLLKDVGVAEDKVDCYIQKYHDNHYFHNTLAIALLGELKISAEQRQREKEKFIAKMVNITRIISEC
jgi:hypothetical protein